MPSTGNNSEWRMQYLGTPFSTEDLLTRRRVAENMEFYRQYMNDFFSLTHREVKKPKRDYTYGELLAKLEEKDGR